MSEPRLCACCSEPCPDNRLFCKECQRHVGEEGWRAIRMSYHSPMYGEAGWGMTDGTNVLWQIEATGDRFATQSLARAVNVMRTLEWNMLLAEIGKRIKAKRRRADARKRLARKDRRGW